MRNVLTIPMEQAGTLIVASDNSGAIGVKKGDLVHVPYETLAYYSFRVAVMEVIAASGEPVSVVINNFCGEEAWELLTRGIQKGLDELQLEHVLITGSTESNFSLEQSAIGLLVLGKKYDQKETVYREDVKMAVIGKPLVGNEVMEKADQVVPLSVFQRVSRLKGAIVWPVGSKGILAELKTILKNSELLMEDVFTEVDVLKSSGPATCFIVLYEDSRGVDVKKLAGKYFHSLQIAAK